MSDAAPSTTGNRLLDTGSSAALNEQIIYVSLETVKKGGTIIIKVFQGSEDQNLLNLIKEHYNVVKRLKPKAVRPDSMEVYFIGMDKKSDPFDPYEDKTDEAW
jgi:23S rRNA (uridine2552-2'-O)-methyltransferase